MNTRAIIHPALRSPRDKTTQSIQITNAGQVSEDTRDTSQYFAGPGRSRKKRSNARIPGEMTRMQETMRYAAQTEFPLRKGVANEDISAA